MSAIYVPSVSRGMLLPSLDIHCVVEEGDEPVDPTPPGSHWLFRPLPFISWADLRSETVIIRNPSVFKATSLSGYTLSDHQRLHTYAFPEVCTIPARSSITLYCCPGSKLSEGELATLPRTALLWKNQDGSLRRKEVLNENGNAVVLYDNRGKEIAALDLPRSDDQTSRGGVDGGDASVMAGAIDDTLYMSLPGVKHAQMLALRTLALTLSYVRLASILLSASFVMVHPDMFIFLTFVAHILDALCRWASSQPGAPVDEFSVVLATLGDRLSAMVLVGSLVVLDGNGRNARMFGGILALDIAANWLQLSVASAAGGSRPLAGVLFIKETGTAPDFTTHLMIKYPLLLTAVSLGNEAFLMWSYILASAALPNGLRPIATAIATRGACLIARWVHVLDEGSFCEDVGDGFPKGNLEAEIAGVLGPSGGSSVAWNALWWALKMCCASRQVLSCIQALISLSTLSSGVIADAAGQDLQRHRPKGSRGRPSGRDNGGGRRARSRSQAR